jgi:RNA polymerase sigma-70 factor (ECF subfamily)
MVRPDFTDVYDAQVWHVYGFLAYRLNNRADAEDLTQQVFERALRAWGRYDDQRASVQTWLIAIARNLLIDHYRADRSSSHDEISVLDDRGSSEEPEYDLGLDPELAQCLGELSQRDREVVALRFGGDLSGPEIAEMLDLSLANVQQILSRSLRRLREALGGAGLLDGERTRAGHADGGHEQ